MTEISNFVAIVISVEVVVGCFIHMIRMISCNLRGFCFFKAYDTRVWAVGVVPTRHFCLSVCVVWHRLHDAGKLEK